MNLGYACINMTLAAQSEKITTNRGMRKKTFLEKGLDYAGSLALLNVKDLQTILEWNVKNDITFFRVSSDIFPWASHYDLDLLPQYDEIKSILFNAGKYAKRNKLRLTFHPGPYNVLTSPKSSVVNNTIKDLKYHAQMCDLLDLSFSTFNKINIHCNGVYGDKKSAMDRFCLNFETLPKSVKTRLTLENDDKASMYSVKDLMYIYEKIGVPIVFDFHHHKFCNGGLSEKDALDLAVSTWPKSVRPVVHYSESKSEHERHALIKPQAHSDYITRIPKTYAHNLDIMIEAKAKELAIMPFLK